MTPNADFPRLTPKQWQALVVLQTEARELTNKELKQLAGFSLTGPDNRKLEDLGLITTDRSHRVFSHQLTDKGRLIRQPDTDTPPTPRQPARKPPPSESALETATQVQALVVLMAEARELTNDELRELAGFSLTGANNRKLEALGLIITDRSHRPFSHQLTDKGWHFVRQLHASTPPRAGGSAIKTLFALLANIHRSLDRLQISHGEFLKRGKNAAPPRPTVDLRAADIEATIRTAYRELVTRPGDWVGLADLREKLGSVDRTAVDDTLRAMVRQEGVRIIPIANTKALQPRDRAAAVRIGEEDNHALAIGST